jgi:hypothetical protein
MRRPARLLLLAVMAVAVGLGALWAATRDDAAPVSGGAAAPAPEDAGPTTPTATPTPRPLSADEVAEPTPGQVVATDDPAPTSGGQVTPVITQAGWAASGAAVEVSGFVAGVVEDGGTCRVTLTREGQTVTGERAALADATTTACGAFELGSADMDAGWWQAVLSYESATSSGSSGPVDVLVPTR